MKHACLLLCNGRRGRCRRVAATVARADRGQYVIHAASHVRNAEGEPILSTSLQGRTGPIDRDFSGEVHVPLCSSCNDDAEAWSTMVVSWPKVHRKINERRHGAPPPRYLPPSG